MTRRRLRWGEKKHRIVRLYAASGTLLVKDLVLYLDALRDGKVKFPDEVNRKLWYSFYRRPRRVIKSVYKSTYNADGKIKLPFEWAEYWIVSFARIPRLDIWTPTERKPPLFRRLLTWPINFGFKIFVSKLKEIADEAERYIETGILEEEPETETEWISRWGDPESQYFLRVMLPCVVLLCRWPHQLFAEAAEGDIEAICALVRLDKTLLFEPTISGHAMKLQETDPKRYVLTIGAAHLGGIPMIDRQQMKVSIATLLYEFFPQGLGPEFRVSRKEFRDLYDAHVVQGSGELGARDRNLPDSSEAFTKAMQRKAPQWKRFIQETLDNL